MLSLRHIRRHLFNAAILNADLSKTLAHANKPLNEIRIVIIGAGLAGLSAASHLIKNGFKHTVILEATERYGGRVRSKQFGDAFCELGAKWIAVNASQNSMYELLRQATGLQKKIQQRSETIYLSTRGENINRKMPEVIDRFFQKLCAGGINIGEKFNSGNLDELSSVHTYFQAESSKIIQSMFQEEEQQLASDIFTSLSKEFASLLGCCLEYVNIEHITKMQMLNHQPAPIYIPAGLDSVLNHIAVNIAEDNMRVGKPVGEIRWYGNSRLDEKSVGCMDGSAFIADHIICTLPLGVLKNFSGYMFKPLLPKEKLIAIKNLGFGSPVKVYFEYESNIKPWFSTNVRPLWSAQERRKDLKWTKQVVEISKLPTSSRVLEVLVGGAFYDEIEKLSDVEVLKEITKLLRGCLKNPKVPYPVSVLRSNWSTCACYLGGRPYFSVDSSSGDVLNLAKPLGGTPTLLFAGDATILNGFGTIDGARMSGIREAQRIINYYNTIK